MSGLKKYLCGVTAAIFTITTIFGCEPEERPEDGPIGHSPWTKPVDVAPVARDGWEIYTGPNYRYGPSIIINDDNSIDIWLATSGD